MKNPVATLGVVALISGSNSSHRPMYLHVGQEVEANTVSYSSSAKQVSSELEITDSMGDSHHEGVTKPSIGSLMRSVLMKDLPKCCHVLDRLDSFTATINTGASAFVRLCLHASRDTWESVPLVSMLADAGKKGVQFSVSFPPWPGRISTTGPDRRILVYRLVLPTERY